MLNYFQIINEVVNPEVGRTYKIYVVHVTLVTKKALEIGRQLGLSEASLELIEVAGMLHDIGVVAVKSPKMDCTGELSYIAHGVAGAAILRTWAEKNQAELNEKELELLEKAALVAERHIGVGLTAQEVAARGLPLPAGVDYLPTSLEEQIITFADLFFSKREATLWQEESADQIEKELTEYGEEQVEVFRTWREKFTKQEGQS